MAVSTDQLPRDANGAIMGLWRVYHRVPSYSGQIGMCILENGVSLSPLYGKPLLSLVAVIGADLFLAPWEGPTPEGFDTPESIVLEIPADALDLLEKPPTQADKPPVVETPVVEEPTEEPTDKYAPMSTAELRARLKDLGVRFHPRTGRTKLIQALREHDRDRD